MTHPWLDLHRDQRTTVLEVAVTIAVTIKDDPKATAADNAILR